MTYFKGKLTRLASHPVANFVVAKTAERISAEHLTEALQELSGVWERLLGAYNLVFEAPVN